jgi:hypothetical protein
VPREERPIVDYDDLADYEGTPWLTALANFCLAVGVFVGVYAVIFLIGYWHRGFRIYWPLLLIIAIDVAINAVVQLVRFRRRRALGLTRSERRRRLGLDPTGKRG